MFKVTLNTTANNPREASWYSLHCIMLQAYILNLLSLLIHIHPQLTFGCSESVIKTSEKGVKYVQK